MKTLLVAAIAALAAKANAECANACSGHGECGNKDQCICYDNFFGSDCSLQRCPSGLAFVDVPNGDLNHDGALGRRAAAADAYSSVQWARYPQAEYWPTNKGTVNADGTISNGGAYAAQSGEAHWYTECSGKGACDRSTGECACFDGYTGAACQRTTCPNDCSGHGVCRTVGEIAAGALNKKFVDSAAGANSYNGVQDAFEYRLWDSNKNQACVCDLGYSGVDCSLRECPRGDDPLTAVAATCGGASCMAEVQGFTLSKSTPAGSKYYINFYDFEGNVWKSPSFSVDHTATTISSSVHASNAANVKAALQALPNSLVGKVTVTASNDFGGAASGVASGAGSNVRYLVTFDSISGNVPEFEVKRDTSTSAMDAVVQPYEPVQYITATVTAGAVLTGYVDPLETSNLRSTQVTATWTTLGPQTGPPATTQFDENVSALKKALSPNSVSYELGSTLPVDVIPGAANKWAVIFKNNPNRPGAAKKIGYNKVRLNVGAAAATVSKDTNDGNTEYSVCSNRGICDHSTGICACFGGYTGSSCDTQSALAQ